MGLMSDGAVVGVVMIDGTKVVGATGLSELSGFNGYYFDCCGGGDGGAELM